MGKCAKYTEAGFLSGLPAALGIGGGQGRCECGGAGWREWLDEGWGPFFSPGSSDCYGAWDGAPETFPNSSSNFLGQVVEGGGHSLIPNAQRGWARKPRQAGVRTPSVARSGEGEGRTGGPRSPRPGGRRCQ